MNETCGCQECESCPGCGAKPEEEKKEAKKKKYYAKKPAKA